MGEGRGRWWEEGGRKKVGGGGEGGRSEKGGERREGGRKKVGGGREKVGGGGEMIGGEGGREGRDLPKQVSSTDKGSGGFLNFLEIFITQYQLQASKSSSPKQFTGVCLSST